jgi:hypothetical protein
LTWRRFLPGDDHENTKTLRGHTPFYLTFGREPLTPIMKFSQSSSPAADDWWQKWADALKISNQKVAENQLRQRAAVDQTRRGGGYQIGDLVFLSTEHLTLPADVSRKLTAKYIGPLEVSDVITDVTVKLKLPDSWRLHNSFHISRLKPAYPGTAMPENQPDEPERLIDNSADNEYEIERIMRSRIRADGRKEYLIRWKGYDRSEDTWEPASGLTMAKEALQDFEDRRRPTRRNPRRNTQ